MIYVMFLQALRKTPIFAPVNLFWRLVLFYAW